MSKLDNIKKSGFKVPDGYFTNLEDRIIDEVKLDNTLQKGEKTSFVMPDGYLDNLENVITGKLAKEEPKVISLFNRSNLMYLSGIAAAILILVAVFVNTNGATIETDMWDDELVENYILEEGIDTYELAALLTEEELTIIDTEIFNEAFADDNLEDYLLENADLEDILDQ